MVDTCHYKYAHKMHNTKVNPNVSYGFKVIMVCQHRLIDCNKYITLVQDVNSGGCSPLCFRT